MAHGINFDVNVELEDIQIYCGLDFGVLSGCEGAPSEADGSLTVATPGRIVDVVLNLR